MNTKESYEVRVKRPDGVSVAEMKQYIVDAVASWHGCYSPEEPIFFLKSKSVTVPRRLWAEKRSR